MFAAAVVILLLLPDPELAHDRVVKSICDALLRQTRYGFDHTEAAAFLLRLPGGGIGFVRWPAAGQADQARWEGAVPSGALAILHTHHCTMPWPSRVDMATARRARLPVYVITLGSITKTTGIAAETVAAE